MAKATRTRKSPQQRAEEALGVAERKVATFEKAVTKHKGKLAEAEAELTDAKRRRDYLAQSPDLPANQQHLDDEPEGDTSARAMLDGDDDSGADE